MRDVAADIAAILEASSTLSLTLGTDLFSGPFPVQAKGALVGVMPLTGTGESYADASEDLWTVDLEVTVRGEQHAYKATLDLALAVFGVLHRARAAPYVSILCDDAVPEWDGYDEQNRPVFAINLTVRYVTTRAGETLVVLPSEGLLRVEGVEFGDGSTLTTAPPPVDLAGYVTLAGTQTLANKTLASPVVTGPLMPSTAGQQALGSAAVPWGPIESRGGTTSRATVVADTAGATNVPAFEAINAGAGATGLLVRRQGQTSLVQFGRGDAQSWGIQHTNRALVIRGAGRAYDTAPYSLRVTQQPGTADRSILDVAGATDQTGDLQRWRTRETDSAHVAHVAADGTIETAAGVVLRSPNGTRYRIRVANDGTLSTEPA